MLKMRLQRIGRRNDASFRVIVTDSRSGPKSGKNVALLGSYNPKENRFQIDTDAAKDWIAKGVQVSDTVHNLLVSEKVIEGKKRNALPRKSPIVSEEAEAAAQAPQAPEAEAPEAESADEGAGEAPAEESADEEAPEAATEADASEEGPTEAPEGPSTEETEEGADKASDESEADESKEGSGEAAEEAEKKG